MHKGILIYNREDYHKNSWFAQQFIEKASLYDMEINLIYSEDLILEINQGSFYVRVRKKKWDKPDFVINRSRNSMIGSHFEIMGCRVFNASFVTEICNHKAKTHQIINKQGIPSVKTLLCNKQYFSFTNVVGNFPMILKSVSGHGGGEIYQLHNQEELKNKLLTLSGEEFILQEICTNPGKDIRVFVLGKEIVAAVKRYSNQSFKSNYSLGGESERYDLNADETAIVEKVINTMDFDFVGIDFILDKDNNFLFNEIEDVVGTRTLYRNYDIDIVKKYLQYIRENLSVWEARENWQ